MIKGQTREEECEEKSHESRREAREKKGHDQEKRVHARHGLGGGNAMERGGRCIRRGVGFL